MTMIVSKFSFHFLRFKQWFEFLEKMLIWFKKVSSVRILPKSDGGQCFESNIWSKLNMQNTTYTKSLS